MSIPTHDKLILPFLQILVDRKEHEITEIRNILANEFNLTDNDLAEEIPSGGKKFAGRVGWARTYLKGAKLIDSPKRAHFVINERGVKALEDNPSNILNYLKQYPEYLEFMGITKKNNFEKQVETIESSETPDEMLSRAQKTYNDNLQSELLSKLKQIDPIRFEQIVLQLMEKMNYGIGSMTPKSHDGGIDGIIDEDELGLEKIYLQAKRYSDNRVNEKEMVYFIGALTRAKVQKGVFITTSEFSDKAIKAARESGNLRIKLVNGEELTKLMIKHNLGVQIKTRIEIKKLDEDFFIEE